MLVLSRKKSEVIHIGDDIHLMVVHIGEGRVRIGIEAPASLKIVRDELLADEDTRKRKVA